MFMADVERSPKRKGCFKGVASSTSSDRRNQALSEKALASMAEQGPIPLSSYTDHRGATMMVESEIGTVSNFSLSEDGQQLMFEGKLDPTHPMYEFYCGKLDDGSEFSHAYKVSIGGWVPTDAVRRVYKSEGTVDVIDTFRLDHLLFCRADSAINQETLIMGMADPADWKGAMFQGLADAVDPGAAMEDSDEDDTESSTEESKVPEVSELYRIIRFALERREILDPDHYLYVIGIYADGIVLYEVEGEGGYQAYTCTWSYGDGGISLTPAVAIERKTTPPTWVTPDGTEIGKAESLMATDDLTEESLVGFAGANTSTKPWSKVDKTKLPKECFLYVGDPEKKSTWKFPVYEAPGKINVNGLEAAAQRLSATTPDVAKVVAPKIRALYKKLGKPLPKSLVGKVDGGKEIMGKGVEMKLASLMGALTDLLVGEAGSAESEEGSAALAEVVEEISEVETTPTPEPGVVGEGMADVSGMINAAVAEAMKPITESITNLVASLTPAQEVVEGKAADETSDEEVETSADEVSEEATSEESAEETSETVEEETVSEEEAAGMAEDENLTVINRNFEELFGRVNELGNAVGSLLERVEKLDLVGKADGGSFQVPPAGATGTSEKRKQGLIESFVLGQRS